MNIKLQNMSSHFTFLGLKQEVHFEFFPITLIHNMQEFESVYFKKICRSLSQSLDRGSWFY